MNCRDTESLILAEQDDALTKDQLAALTDHVATCPACAQLRTNLVTALATYKAGVAAISVPNADEAWRDLQVRLRQPARKRPLAPVIWFGSSLAAAAAIAFAFLSNEPRSVTPAPASPQLYDSSIIAGADYVEAGDPNASIMVYVDKESGWLVVWATDPGTDTSG